MENQNPYTAPETDPTLPSIAPGIELAGLLERFVGSLIDGLIGVAIVIPLWLAFVAAGLVGSFAEIGKAGFLINVGITVIYFMIFIAIQWKFLAATGQSIGKKVAKTRIVTMEGAKPDPKDLVIKRYGFVTLVSLIPVVGGLISLVDALLVFKKDRRTLHDLVAGTQVIKVRPGDVIS